MFEFIEVINIKYYQGRAEFLPWSFWGESTKEKKKNTEQSHAGLLHCPPTVIAASYVLSLDPTHCGRVLRVVVVSYASSLDLTHRCQIRLGPTPHHVRIAAVVFSPVLLLLVPLLLLLLLLLIPLLLLLLLLLLVLPLHLRLVLPVLLLLVSLLLLVKAPVLLAISAL